jgi:serine protease Do
VRIAYALTAAALVIGSATSLAVRGPAGAQQSAEPTPQNAPARMPDVQRSVAPASFAELTERLQPAVVNISTTQQVEVGRFPQIMPGMNFEDLFRQFQQGGEPVTREATSLGSGFIVDPSGYIVTNNHVISGRNGDDPVDRIMVTLFDRREFEARVVGRDPLSDLALLKISATGLPYVRFGDSAQARVGDWVMAIGNPFGLGGTVTQGIISALHRNIQSGLYDRYIQTDASINQGNSGGPLFDLKGNVVGINTAIFSPTGGNVGVGFAIPAEQAKPVIDQLRSIGRVRRGYLGVGVQRLSEDIAAGLGLPKDQGEIVANIEPGGPAARSGIRVGDVIVKIDGRPVTVDNTLSYLVANARIGSSVPIELIRNGRRQTVQATIAERPSEQALATPGQGGQEGAPGRGAGEQAAQSGLGLSLQELTPDIRRQLGLTPDVQGVVVVGVDPRSDAAAKGLRRGDIIRAVNQTPLTSVAQAVAAVEAARRAGRDTVLLYHQRGNRPATYIGVELMGR